MTDTVETCLGCGRKRERGVVVHDAVCPTYRNEQREAMAREKTMPLRRVKVYAYGKTETGATDRLLECEGFFHRWGHGFVEFETGPGNYTTAIVELDDGSIRSINAEMIEFVTPLYQ